MRTPARNAIIAGSSAAFIAIVVGVYVGTRTSETNEARTRVTVGWGDAGVPSDVECLWTTGLAGVDALQLFDLAHDGGPSYVYCRVCASPTPEPEDGGELPPPELPPGMLAFETGQVEEAYDGGPQLLCVLYGEPEWPAACSPGRDAGCESQLRDGGWADAPLGRTLPEGTWRGGCIGKAPVELYGVSSWPPQCPRR